MDLLSWARNQSKRVSIGLFFLWGLMMSLLSVGIGRIWTIPILLLVTAVSVGGIYFGWLKDGKGKRGALGLALNGVAMIYNLSIAGLYFLV